jgi:hypothetical protein
LREADKSSQRRFNGKIVIDSNAMEENAERKIVIKKDEATNEEIFNYSMKF